MGRSITGRAAMLALLLMLGACGGGGGGGGEEDFDPAGPGPGDGDTGGDTSGGGDSGGGDSGGGGGGGGETGGGGSAGDALADSVRTLVFDAAQPGNPGSVEITVTDGDQSLLFSLRARNDADFVWVTEVRAPDGALVYRGDDSAVTGGTLLPLNADPLADAGDIAMLIPMSPDAGQAQLQAGTWRVAFASDDPSGPARAVAHLKRIENAPAGFDLDRDTSHRLDLNIWVTDGAYASPEAQASFTALLENQYRARIDGIMSDDRIRLGVLEVRFASGADLQNAAYTRPNPDNYAALCRRMAQIFPPGRAVQLGFVEQIPQGGGNAGTTGDSSGLPGVILDAAARRSCVIVNGRGFDDLAAAVRDDMQAANILHESGHFLGLFHTSEETGADFDPLDDTPQCTRDPFDAPNGNGDNRVDARECGANGGATNVMFWEGDEQFPDLSLSADQAWVLRRHPILRLVGD